MIVFKKSNQYIGGQGVVHVLNRVPFLHWPGHEFCPGTSFTEGSDFCMEKQTFLLGKYSQKEIRVGEELG